MHTCREPGERQCDMRDKVVIGGDLCLRNTIDGQACDVLTHDTGTFDHNELINRDLPDQHPMSAITGLSAAFDEKANISDLAPIAFLDSEGITILECGTSTEVI